MGHNEPTEFSETLTGKVTAKALLACVKLGSDSLSLHAVAAVGRASYSDAFVFEITARRTERKKNAETTSRLDVPGYVSNGHDSTREERVFEGRKVVSYAGVHRPTKGHWFLSYAPRERLLDVLELLPSEAEVSFFVYLDAGTNENLIRADVHTNYGTEQGLHSDHLYLEATWVSRGKRVVRRYLVDVSTGSHNTARFGVGRS